MIRRLLLRWLLGRSVPDVDSWEGDDVEELEESVDPPGEWRYCNRSAAILLPKKPMVRWLNKTCGMPMSLEQMRAQDDKTVYLLEPWEGSWDRPQVLQAHYRVMFESELEEWSTNRKRWPQKRDLKTFRKWFDIEWSSGVVDLAGGPIEPLSFE